MKHTLTAEQCVPKSRSDIFAFFSRAENLEALTPSFMNFSILTPLPIRMAKGTLIDYRIRLFGLPLRWRTRIEAFEPEQCFVDVQLQGPYRLWHHTHTFESIPGGTRILDRVVYDVGFGLAGDLAHTLFVRRTLDRIFAFRQTVVARLFGTLESSEASATDKAQASPPTTR